MPVLHRLLPHRAVQRWRDALEAWAQQQPCRPPSVRLGEIPDDLLTEMLSSLRGCAAMPPLHARLGPQLLCNLDQCWARWQSPPSLRPPGHHPHSWHQDGALGHDFTLPRAADGGLLDMSTLWLALDRCGDRAPGLEWLAEVPTRLLDPAELAAAPTSVRRVRLEPGDALVFDGALLHRTQTPTPEMTRSRWSVEFRFFGSAPARLGGQRLLAL